MKKFVTLLLAVAMAALLCACGEEKKDEGVMSYADFVAAEVDAPVVVDTYVQAKQGWWEDNGQGKASIYSQEPYGAYFIYDMKCTEEEYNKLNLGTKIRVTGFKSEWSGEVEIVDATFTLLDEGDTFVAVPKNVTDLLGTDKLIDSQNQYVYFEGLEIAPCNDGAAFNYKWDNSGSDGDDLYFNVTDGTNTYTFTVESYLTGAGTDVYEAVKALNVGDKVDLEGFLYWYEGANPHITSVTVK